MFTAFLYAKGIIHHKCVPETQTVNGKFYKKVIMTDPSSSLH
jgi:hypothetical protein